MKNLMRGHLYQLKKDNLLFGCIAFSVIFLIVSLRMSFSLASAINPVTGIENLMNTLLGGDVVLYAFMLLAANMVTETYRSGVMKNIVGRGIAKKQYYFSVILAISAVYLLVTLICGIVAGILAGSKFGIGTFSYPAYYALAIVARILFTIVHISFAVTTTIYTRNEITGFVFALAIPNIPKFLEMACGFLKINISLDAIKISSHMPSVYDASNNLSSFLPCFAVLCAYFVLSIAIGLRIFKQQDIK